MIGVDTKSGRTSHGTRQPGATRQSMPQQGVSTPASHCSPTTRSSLPQTALRSATTDARRTANAHVFLQPRAIRSSHIVVHTQHDSTPVALAPARALPVPPLAGRDVEIDAPAPGRKRRGSPRPPCRAGAAPLSGARRACSVNCRGEHTISAEIGIVMPTSKMSDANTRRKAILRATRDHTPSTVAADNPKSRGYPSLRVVELAARAGSRW